MKTTGFSRVSKDLIIKEIEGQIKNHPTFFVVEQGTVSATSMDKLRAKLRTSKTRYMSVKKSLGRKALENTGMSAAAESLTGAPGIAFSSGDVVSSSKTLVGFAKENEAFKIHLGMMNGKMITADQVKELANLPSREVLVAKVLGGMQAPISRFVGVLAGTMRKVVTALDAIAKKKQT